MTIERQPADEEAEHLPRQLQALAREYRRILSDPETKRQIEAGVLSVSPLVRELLAAFPPDSET